GGKKRPVKTVADWGGRRGHILRGMEAAMGPLPGAEKRVPLDVKVLGEAKVGRLLRRELTLRAQPGTPVPAYPFPPGPPGKQLAAVLCLQQTTKAGKNEPAGLAGNPNLHYALHLADRGYVTLAPDYPSFGEYPYEFGPKSGYASGSMKAVWDNVRAVDLLQS